MQYIPSNPAQDMNFCVPNDPSHYPIYAFPEKIRGAIFEVWQETQAPLPLVAASALSALSLACQHLVDAVRPKGFISPCSLFLLTIADSGERKTSSDRFFTKPVRDFEIRKLKENEEKSKNYEIDLDIWKTIEKGLNRKIQRLIGRGDNCDEAVSELRQHHECKPIRPAQMRMIFDDISPTSIISSLQNNWPSAGIISDEAGKIFDGKSLLNIGLLNKLWDGHPVSHDRHRASDSYFVPNGRMTVSLMSQKKTLRDFLEKQGHLARDNGFLARCLVCFPVSTQGTRYINPDQVTQQPTPKPQLEKFNEIIDCLLNHSWEIHKKESPKHLFFMQDDAARYWAECHNKIESTLGPMNLFSDIKDSASKVAENIARIACIFQTVDFVSTQNAPKITLDTVKAADIICEWYINQFKLIFGDNQIISGDMQNANELMIWLERTWASNGWMPIRKNSIRQLGPNKIRNKDALEFALNILQNQNKIWIGFTGAPGKKFTVYINKGPMPAPITIATANFLPPPSSM